MTEYEEDQLAEALKESVEKAAAQLSLSVEGLGKTKGKTYEVWVLFRLATHLKALGVHVSARSHKDESTTTFRIKGGPGKIHPTTASSPKPSHFRISKSPGSKRIFEIHVSLEHRGVSDVSHEVDISVISGEFATAIRNKPEGGDYQGPRYACLELKNYATDKELDKNVARAFLAVRQELGGGTAISRKHDIISAMVSHVSYSLITAASVGESSAKLLKHYHISSLGGVIPNSTEGDDFLHTIAYWLDLCL